MLASKPILAFPESNLPYGILTNYSHIAIAAILEQQKVDNKQHVISYALQCCSKAKCSLDPTDGELLAILYAVEKFYFYVAGTTFTIVTHHST